MSSGFVSEVDLEERRRIRQENWEKTRSDDDPIVAPPELDTPYDNRTLFERLQEQKQKKQDEFEESHKFKNMVRGLEDDEVNFLELVDRSKLQEEQRVKSEESAALAEYRKKVSEMLTSSGEVEVRADVKSGEVQRTSGSKRTSQLSLLAGAVKRRSTSESATSEAKRSRSESDPDVSVPVSDAITLRRGLECIAVLPGLGVYTDSSDSDNPDDSDSDDPDMMHHHHESHALTGRTIRSDKECCSGRH